MSPKKVKIPQALSDDLAYYIGMMLGDGSLPISKQPGNYSIQFGNTNKDYLEHIVIPLVYKLFEVSCKLETINDKRAGEKGWSQLYMVRFKSKDVYDYLISWCGIPGGKKSAMLDVPALIAESTLASKLHFLAGFFDTDGGMQGGSFGFHIASKKLRDEINDLLLQLGFSSSIRDSYNYKYQKNYYQLSLTKQETIKLLSTLPFRNKKKIVELEKVAGLNTQL